MVRVADNEITSVCFRVRYFALTAPCRIRGKMCICQNVNGLAESGNRRYLRTMLVATLGSKDRLEISWAMEAVLRTSMN